MSEPTDNPHPRPRVTVLRTTATTLAAALTFAAVVPPLASAREAESEGEGSGPPGLTLPGLEEAFEPGGEETGLGEAAAGSGEEEAEEAPQPEVEVAPPETAEAAPPMEPEMPAPPAEEAPPVTHAPPAASTAPVYEAGEEAGPSYETAAPAPPAEAVRNEAIVGPQETGRKGAPGKAPAETPPSAVVQGAPEPGPVEPPEEPSVPSTPAVTSTVTDRPGSLSGHGSHTVAPGECLWSIAEAVLPARASDTEVAAEVSRLWHLNSARIGTGDPNLIYAGTVLRLHD